MDHHLGPHGWKSLPIDPDSGWHMCDQCIEEFKRPENIGKANLYGQQASHIATLNRHLRYDLMPKYGAVHFDPRSDGQAVTLAAIKGGHNFSKTNLWIWGNGAIGKTHLARVAMSVAMFRGFSPGELSCLSLGDTDHVGIGAVKSRGLLLLDGVDDIFGLSGFRETDALANLRGIVEHRTTNGLATVLTSRLQPGLLSGGITMAIGGLEAMGLATMELTDA